MDTLMRAVRIFIWLATIGAVALMFWPLVGQLLASMQAIDPGLY